MALRQTKKISELPALSPASLDTTFVVGISGSTTYKISINQLTSSLDTTFATDLVTATLSGSLDGKLTTSSFNSYTASISTASLVTSISNLNTFTASQSTSSLVNRLNAIENVSGSWITESETGSFLTSLNGAISSSAQITTFGFVSGSYETTGRGIISSSANLVNTSSFNSYTASISTASLVDRLNELEFSSSRATASITELYDNAFIWTQKFDLIDRVSGSWITESETGSFLTSLNGAISSSSQLTSSYDTRYVLSGSITQTTWDNIASKPVGIVSSSVQVLGGSGVVSGSYETTGRGIISSSTQIVSGLENATITNLTITNLHSVYQTSSVVYASGSNQFGDALTDSHIFSGSIIIVGSGSINGYNILTSNDTGSFETTGRGILSGSISYNNLTDIPQNIASGSYETTGRGILSGSISYNNLTNTPSGIISSSSQLPSGVISGSSQLTSSYDTRYSLSGSIPTSFSQSVDSRLDNLEAEISSSVSYAYVTYITEPEVPNDDINGFLKPDGNISGSISYNQTTGYFTLLAGKTYKLRAVVNTTGGGIYWDLQWKDVTNNIFVGARSNDIANVPNEAFAIVTPNTNIQVGLRSLSNPANGHPYIIKNSTFFFIEEMALGIVEGITGSTDYTQITNKPTLISGSSQLTSSYDTRYVISGSITQTTWDNIGSKPSGIVSGSSQILGGSGLWSGSAQLPAGVVSGSSQVLGGSGVVSGSYETTGRSIVSSSAQIVPLLPAGVVSGSSQILGGSGIYSSSAQLPVGIVSGSSQLTTSFDGRYTQTGSFNSFTSSINNWSSSISTFGTLNTDYIQVQKSADQTGVAKNTDITFNVVTATNSGITHSNGVFTLTAGKTYVLEASLCINTFSDAAAYLWWSWVDSTTNTQLDTSNGGVLATGASGVAIPTTWTTNDNYVGYAKLIYTPATNQTIKVRATDGSGTCKVLAIASKATITQINPSVALNQFSTLQVSGSLSVTGSLTANLTNGYAWVGNSLNNSYEFPTASLLSTASFNSFTSSQFNTLSASVASVQTNLNQVTASLGVTSTPFTYTGVVNPSNYVLVSYTTASYNGGSMDIIVTRASDSTATSVNCLLASFGANGDIAVKGSTNSGAGAPNPSFTMALSGSYMNIRISVSAGTYTIKGVARLF